LYFGYWQRGYLRHPWAMHKTPKLRWLSTSSKGIMTNRFVQYWSTRKGQDAAETQGVDFLTLDTSDQSV
jgi:hypothetical protein